MASVLRAMKAKSDQLNYVDIGANGELIATVEGVTVTDGDQGVAVYYTGCENRPWKPSKGMIRVLAAAWGEDADNWVGKTAKLYGEKSVKWAGQEIGGIRIRALTHIDKKGLTEFIQLNSNKRVKQTIPFFDYEPGICATDQGWIDAIKADPAVMEQLEDGAYKEHIKKLLN